MDKKAEYDFLSLLLPHGLLEYFNLSHFTRIEQKICLYLEEKNIVPEEYSN